MALHDRWSDESGRSSRPLAAALLLLVLGLALTSLVTWLQGRSNDARVAREFDMLAEEATHDIFERFRRYEYGLRGLRGSVLMLGRDSISRQQIRTYAESRDIDAEFPGARGFGFIRRVPAEHEAAFLAAARSDGVPEFALRQLQPSDRDRYVIQYIEPIERNRPALGLDIASEVHRRTAADLALRTGGVAITRPVTLMQAPGERLQGFLVLLPVYQPGMPLTTVAEREAAGFGWTYAPLTIDEVLRGFDLRGGAFTLSLFDGGDGGDGNAHTREQFYGPRELDDPLDDPLVRHITRPIFGRTWQAELRALPPFVARLNLLRPETLFAAGALISTLLAALAFAYLLSRQRQRQLIIGQLRLATILENSSDAIIAETLEGVITRWNRAAERIFGYRADEAIGRSSAALLPPVTSDRNGESMLMSVRHGGAIDPFDQVCRRRDGSRVEVSITASPITASDGRVIGMGKTIRDISARKEAERQLHEFNTRLEHQVRERTAQLETASRDLQTILDLVPSTIGYWDARLTCRFANRAYHRWFGVEPKSLPGRHIRELLGESLFAANRPFIEGALRGETQAFERAIPRPDDGGIRHALVYYLPDLVDGEVRGFYALVHDVTEITESRQKLATAIRENEALLRTVKSYVLYTVTDRGGTIIDVNEVMCKTSGYRRDELLGRNHRIFSSGTHSPAFWADMWATIGSGRPWRGELCDRTKDGSLFWSDTLIAPFFGANGEIERYVAIRTDITANKAAARRLELKRQRLAASEVFLERTGQLAKVGGWQLELETGQLTWTSETRRIHDVPPDYGPMQDQAVEFFTPEARPMIRGALAETAAKGESFDLELPLVTALGRPIWVRVIGEAEYAAEGDRARPVRLIGAVQDITARRAADDALRAAKGAFLANMSHEIRTPLNAIIGLTYLLARSARDAEQHRFVSTLQIAGRALLDIVNDVLDLAKIEAGSLALDVAPFDLRALLDDLAAVFGAQAHAKDLLLTFDVPAELPPLILGDATRVRQLLTNLLGNAIKFTERGSVHLNVTAAQAATDRLRACFTVRDTGIGISPEAQARIFTPFEQGDASTTRRFGGTGLGLSIVHQLVELMGGELSVQSALGQGSAFRVLLPLSLPARPVGAPGRAQPPLHVEQGPRLSSIRILVVDDNEFNREIAECILVNEGAIVTTCCDGQEALDQLRATPDAFDIVLMDVQMPRMDGNEATSRIRGELGLNELPVIALTAGALIAERQRALDAGMNDFASKPLNPDALIRLVRRHAEARRGGPARRPTAPPLRNDG